MDRLEALNAQWRTVPPVADMVASYLQYKPPPPKIAPSAVTSNDPSGIGSLIMQFPSGHVPAARP